MGTTTKKLPYPEPIDPVAGGATAIRNLAEALDFTRIVELTAVDIPNAAAPFANYPLGVSLLPVSSAEATAGNWPIPAGAGTVVTVKQGARAGQWFYLSSTTNARAMFRSLSGGGASPWGGTGPYGTAIGTATLDGANNPTAPVSVTFPANRFTVAPRVMATAYSSAWVAVPNTITATSMQLLGRSIVASSGTFTVAWQAVQATETAANG